MSLALFPETVQPQHELVPLLVDLNVHCFDWNLAQLFRFVISCLFFQMLSSTQPTIFRKRRKKERKGEERRGKTMSTKRRKIGGLPPVPPVEAPIATSESCGRRSSRIQDQGKRTSKYGTTIIEEEKDTVPRESRKRKADLPIEDDGLIKTPALPAAAAAAAVENIAPSGVDWENSVEDITQVRALGREFCLTQKKLDTLKYKSVENPYYRSAAQMKLFAARDVWKAAIELHGSPAKIRARAKQRDVSAVKRRDTIANKPKPVVAGVGKAGAGGGYSSGGYSYGGYSSGDESFDSEGFHYGGRGRRYTDQYGEYHYDEYPSSKKKKKKKKKRTKKQVQQKQQQTPNTPARYMDTDDYKNDVRDARAHLRKARDDINNNNHLPRKEKDKQIRELEQRHNVTMNKLKTGDRLAGAGLADQIQVKCESDEEKHVIGPVPAAVPILAPTTAPVDSNSSLADQIQVKCESDEKKLNSSQLLNLTILATSCVGSSQVIK